MLPIKRRSSEANLLNTEDSGDLCSVGPNRNQGSFGVLKRSKTESVSLQSLANSFVELRKPLDVNGDLNGKLPMAPSELRPLFSNASISANSIKNRLILDSTERKELENKFGADKLDGCLQHDNFANVTELARQLAHENKTEITLADFLKIKPFAFSTEPTIEIETRSSSADDDPGVTGHEIESFKVDGKIVGVIHKTFGENDQLLRLSSKGQFTFPPGWTVEDRLIKHADGKIEMRSCLTGPNHEAGMIRRSFNGSTLWLNKAYKSTLPTRINGLNGFDRPCATMNFMTARACKVLGVNQFNLKKIKVHQLQHQPTLIHIDWLLSQMPGKSVTQVIDHTTWTKSYIKETADIVGHTILPNPKVDLQESTSWRTSHPNAKLRDWDYLKQQTKRLTFKHLTGGKLPKVDDRNIDWENAADVAFQNYKLQKTDGLDIYETQQMCQDIDRSLTTKLASIESVEEKLRRRYGLEQPCVPRHINFDVTFSTKQS
jgi:hypothetical protein